MHFYLEGAVLLALAVAATLASVVRARDAAARGERRRLLRQPELLVVAVGLILALTLIPSSGSSRLVLDPLHGASGLGVVGNVLLFMPLGAVLSMRSWPVARSTLTGLALSVAIELVQLAIPGRWSTTDDVLVNTVGTFLGWQVGSRVLARIAYAREM